VNHPVMLIKPEGKSTLVKKKKTPLRYEK